MYNIVIVGCGATGSNLVALLSQYAISEKRIKSLTLIDGDYVEKKNFKNQKFTEKDVNKNKAKVLANRYAKLGISINYKDDYIRSENDLIPILNELKGEGVILIGCVDNILARRHMHHTFISNCLGDIIYIDTGNGDIERKGQTVVGVKINGVVLKEPVASIFPEILTAKEEAEEVEYKCSAIEDHPQNMAVNVMSASVVFGVVTNIITFNKKSRNVIRFNLESITIK